MARAPPAPPASRSRAPSFLSIQARRSKKREKKKDFLTLDRHCLPHSPSLPPSLSPSVEPSSKARRSYAKIVISEGGTYGNKLKDPVTDGRSTAIVSTCNTLSSQNLHYSPLLSASMCIVMAIMSYKINLQGLTLRINIEKS